MSTPLSGVVVLLQGQAPDIEPFRGFKRELERRVKRGEISVVWTDGGPVNQPLFATTATNKDLPFEERLFPAMGFEFQNTQGFHDADSAEVTSQATRDAKIEQLRLLKSRGVVDIISVTLPYSDNAYIETQRRKLHFSAKEDPYKVHVLIAEPNGFYLPVGQSMEVNPKFRDICDKVDANFYWSPLHTHYRFTPDQLVFSEDLLSFSTDYVDRGSVHKRQNTRTGDRYFSFQVEPGMAKISELQLAQIFHDLRLPRGAYPKYAQFDAQTRDYLASFLANAAQMDFEMDEMSDLTVNRTDDVHGIFVVIDDMFLARKSKALGRIDFDTIPLDKLSAELQKEVLAARVQLDDADVALAQRSQLIEEAQAELDELTGAADAIRDEIAQQKSIIANDRATVTAHEAAVASREALAEKKINEQRIADTEIIREIADVLERLNRHSDDKSFAGKRVRSQAKKDLVSIVERNKQQLSQIALDIAARNFETHQFADGVTFVLVQQGMTLSGAKIGFLNDIPELDGVRFLSNLAHRSAEQNPDEIEWFISLDKLVPPNTFQSLRKYFVKAAFDLVDQHEETAEEILETLLRVRFTETRVVLEPESDTAYLIERALSDASPEIASTDVIDVAPVQPTRNAPASASQPPTQQEQGRSF